MYKIIKYNIICEDTFISKFIFSKFIIIIWFSELVTLIDNIIDHILINLPGNASWSFDICRSCQLPI